MMNMTISLLLRLFTRWLHFKLPQQLPVDQGVGLKVCILSITFTTMDCIKCLSYTIIPHCNLQTLLNILNSAESNFLPEHRTIDSSSPNQPVCDNISSVEVELTELFIVFLGTSDPGVVVNSSALNAQVAINCE